MALVEESTAARLQQQARDHLWLHFTRMGGYREVDVTGLFAVQLGYSYGDEIGAAAHAQMKELPFYTNWSYHTHARSSWPPRWPRSLPAT